jgi:hypothetical protein
MAQTTFTYSTGDPSTSDDVTLTQSSRDGGRILTGVVVGTNVTSLGNNCFASCSGLTTITIPNNVISLGDGCFYGCTGLTTITISNNVTSLGDDCFSICTGLTTITIPNSVTSLGSGCFYNCTGLTTITIPNSVISLGNYCFELCSNLTNVMYENPSIIAVGSQPYSSTPVMTVKFYNTAGTPSTGVYNTALYTDGSTFQYFTGASCYNEGSKILILDNGEEKYVNIETLKKGMLVKTYLHGYKAVKMIGKNFIVNNVKNNLKSMYKINDLIVTGGHCLLVDNLNCDDYSISIKQNKKIDDKHCLLVCDNERAEKIFDSNVYTIYHFVIDYDENEIDGNKKRYGVYTNDGMLSESTSEYNFIHSKFIIVE